MEPTPDECAVRIVKMTTKNLDYYINITDKAAAEFEKIDASFESSSVVGKVLLNGIKMLQSDCP